MKLLIICLIALSLACNSNVPVKSPCVSEYSKNEPTLPSGANNLKEVGNGWITFEVEMVGKKRKFLYARMSNNYGPSAVITELSD